MKLIEENIKKKNPFLILQYHSFLKSCVDFGEVTYEFIYVSHKQVGTRRKKIQFKDFAHYLPKLTLVKDNKYGKIYEFNNFKDYISNLPVFNRYYLKSELYS